VMMISMNAKNNKKARPGVALLVVLFIVMAITILSLGFVSRSDVELACGQNMILRTEMDYLAESGLEHARGLILNPQDIGLEDWTGIHTELQLVEGSSDYYNVTVNRDSTDFCNYIIECNAYRLQGGDTIGRSSVIATLRLDPCIAYWAGESTTISSRIAITGDVYCNGTLINNGTIDGDAFATSNISGTITGRKNETVTLSYPVAWPNLSVTDFEPKYYIGATLYSAQQIVGVDIPSPGLLTDVQYCTGNVNMPDNVTINGTLVVGGDLTISGINNVITAQPNFPALVVGGQVLIKDGSSLVINGLAQIRGPIAFEPGVINANIQVTGGLFINSGGIEGITSSSVVVSITAAPAIASIETWTVDGTSKRWGPAAGAFFRSIERIK